jgi:hypothetical protein
MGIFGQSVGDLGGGIHLLIGYATLRLILALRPYLDQPAGLTPRAGLGFPAWSAGQASPLLPSAVFAADGRLLVGRDAERSARADPAAFEPYPKQRVDDGRPRHVGTPPEEDTAWMPQ